MHLRGPIVRLPLMKIFNNLNLPDIESQTFELLNKLNIYEKTAERSLSFNEILNSCYEFNTDLMKQLKLNDIHIILINYFNFLEENELSVRMAVINGFENYFQKIGEIDCISEKD